MDNLGVLLGALGAFLVVIVAIAIAFWVMWSISTYKVLKAFGYANPWMAWIPILNYFALAQITADKDKNTTVIKWKIPTIAFSLWFIVGWVLAEIPNVGSLLNIILQVICLGTCFTFIYSKCEGKTIEEVQAIGYISGLIPIIALCKFLSYKSDVITANINASNTKSDEDLWDDILKEGSEGDAENQNIE